MKFDKKKLSMAIAVASIACLPAAYATWQDGGYGVVVFNTTTNPSKIIFLDQLRSAELNSGRGTDRTQYNSSLSTSNSSKARNAYPSGTIPEREYDPQRGGLDYTRVTTSGPMVWSHISKSAGAPCLTSQSNCPQPGQVSSSSSCTYSKVKTTISGEISGGVELAAKVNNVDTTSGASATGTLIREWESGWEACQSEGTSHSCPVDQNLTFNAVNYATTEARSKFGWQKFVTSGNTFYFNTRYKDADVRFCETTIGGVYQSGGFVIEPKVGRCNVNSGRTKPNFERFERMPIANSASTPPIIPTCRTIKGS
ncbi:MAG: hypothetical protein V4673_17440 [Pseudomonadota bacterium]